MKPKKKRKNPQDATLRNNKARKKEIEKLKESIAKLENRIEGIEEWVQGIAEVCDEKFEKLCHDRVVNAHERIWQEQQRLKLNDGSNK